MQGHREFSTIIIMWPRRHGHDLGQAMSTVLHVCMQTRTYTRTWIYWLARNSGQDGTWLLSGFRFGYVSQLSGEPSVRSCRLIERTWAELDMQAFWVSFHNRILSRSRVIDRQILIYMSTWQYKQVLLESCLSVQRDSQRNLWHIPCSIAPTCALHQLLVLNAPPASTQVLDMRSCWIVTSNQ
jgi:hypothetical protein